MKNRMSCLSERASRKAPLDYVVEIDVPENEMTMTIQRRGMPMASEADLRSLAGMFQKTRK